MLDRLSLYLDGELAAGARSEVEAHLRSCAGCSRHLEELAAVDAAARELPVPAPPGYFDSLPARVRARLPAPRRRTPPVWVWAAAAGLALAALAPFVLQQTVSPVPEAARTDEEPGRVPPPASPATLAPAEAPLAVGTRDKLAEPAPTLKARAAENAARAPAGPPPPPTPPPASTQVQKHGGPWAQAPAGAQAPPAAQGSQVPQAAAHAEEARGEAVQVEDHPARAPKEDAQREAASEGKVERDQARRGLSDSAATFAEAPSEETRYRDLLARRPVSAGEDRRLHDSWRAFAASYPTSPRADEARVRALEALLSAYRREGEARDRERLREEADLYLRRGDAAQAPRVRAILDRIQ